MDSFENVWQLVEPLATALDGNRETSEGTLDQLETELRGVPKPARDEIRRQMIVVVAALSRLEVRFVSTDGPLDWAV